MMFDIKTFDNNIEQINICDLKLSATHPRFIFTQRSNYAAKSH